MRNKKGFTLVELVIVIAVIAILAGVMIAVFANVVKDAQESAKLQELKSQEIAQKADDIIKKVDNANWLGWEDFEDGLVARMTEVYVNTNKLEQTDINVLQEAVKAAVAQYYAGVVTENTGLTETQVKTIVENALKGGFSGVTESQVRAIVTAATAGTSTLTRAQVQAIVDSASTKNLTGAQISTLVGDAVRPLLEDAATKNDVDAQASAILAKVEAATANLSKLTEKQVEDIVNAAVWSAGGVTKTWFDVDTYDTTDTFTLGTSTEAKLEQEVAGLATLVNGGYNFDGKKVVIKEDIATEATPADITTVALPEENWTPIGNTRGNEFKGTIDGGKDSAGTPLTVINGLTLDQQFSAVKEGYLINCTSTGHMDKVGVGFVAYLGEGATLSNIKFTNVKINMADAAMDGISVGVAVGYLDGGTIENVTVDSGSIKSVYRVGGLCGAAAYGTIKKCTVNTGVVIESTGKNGIQPIPTGSNSGSYYDAGGVIGYLRNFAIKGSVADLPQRTVTIIDTVANATVKSCAANNQFSVAVAKYNASVTFANTESAPTDALTANTAVS